ncbi:MAG: hypothetical protein IJA23_04890 [Clostridia bacterium]|nr:hypothetical protein [Clostridia bacterium]
MDKFRKLCKKPLIIVALSLMGACLLGWIVMLCIPHGKTYVYKYEVGTVQYTYKIELGDKFVETHTVADDSGKETNLKTAKDKEYEYEVSNGKLFLLDGFTDEKVEIGEINSRKLSLNYNIEKDGDNAVLYCSVNRALSIVFSIGIYFGVFLLAICITVNYIHKKQELLKEKAENIAEVQREKQEAEMAAKKEA